MFLLDTNVVSELRKAGDGKADRNVTAWLSRSDASSFYLSAITLMELEIGVLRVERPRLRRKAPASAPGSTSASSPSSPNAPSPSTQPSPCAAPACTSPTHAPTATP